MGVAGLSNRHGDTVRLKDGARRAFYEIATSPSFADVIVAVASTSLEPSYSHACLEGIVILPGRTLRQMIRCVWRYSVLASEIPDSIFIISLQLSLTFFFWTYKETIRLDERAQNIAFS